MREKPRGLAATTALMCLFNLFSLAAIDVTSPLQTAAGMAVMVASYLVLWFYWKGRNWARWLVLITSVLALLNLFLLSSVPLVGQITILFEAPLGLFLLVWLNRPEVKAYFIPDAD